MDSNHQRGVLHTPALPIGATVPKPVTIVSTVTRLIHTDASSWLFSFTLVLLLTRCTNAGIFTLVRRKLTSEVKYHSKSVLDQTCDFHHRLRGV